MRRPTVSREDERMIERTPEDPAALLRAYDEQLRRDAEVQGADVVTEDGPLVRGVFSWGGFVSYRDLDGVDDLDALIARTVAYYRDETSVDEFEWKTRGHDLPVDLTERLLGHGFIADEAETVMAGSVEHLTDEVEIPGGVSIKQAIAPDDIARAAVLQFDVFGDGPTPEQAEERLARSKGYGSLWMAEFDGQAISAGRLEIVPGTEFAGLWGGVTQADWRGKGIYRGLTAARARHARERGVRYLHSDSLETSRPILERSGLVKITTTTPYVWHRHAESRA